MLNISKFMKVPYWVYKKSVERNDIIEYKESEILKKYESIDNRDLHYYKHLEYNFKAPFGFRIYPGVHLTIPTGIGIITEDNWRYGNFNNQKDSPISLILEPMENSVTTIESKIFPNELISKGHIVLQISVPFDIDVDHWYNKGDMFANITISPQCIISSATLKSDITYFVMDIIPRLAMVKYL